MRGADGVVVAPAEDVARASLASLYLHLREAGCAAPVEARGQLIRPMLALAGAEALGVERDERFWAGVAAVQLAHEASLVHDDVIDGAATRRSQPTLVASRGVAAALVEGDHLLTTAYRLAATTASVEFTTAFAHAVERTVAGEKLQGRSSGIALDERAYRGIVSMKSGELLGCALATAPLVRGDARAGEWYVLGRRIGTLYQMLDDLLDYCPAADSGKPALGDFAQRRWTWPLLELPAVDFGMDAAAVAALLATPDATGRAPVERCVERFRREAEAVLAAAAACMPGTATIRDIVDGWTRRIEAAACTALAAQREQVLRASIEERVKPAGDLQAFFAVNSRSFSFAAGLFPAGFRERVRGLYAFCRVTDDLADSDDGWTVADRLARLDLWERLARSAYDGALTGIAILDDVMLQASRAGVPFTYVEELIEGMRMDLRGQRYATLDELRTYSYRVAGVVGQWMTRMCGVHDDITLTRAAQLGHAMQLTNILRDVGDDLRAGRLYLPAQVLRRFGITEQRLRQAVDGHGQPPGYARLLEHLMQVADHDYGSALQAVAALPRQVRPAIVVAAHVYRGIHDAIRSNGYDNFNLRARASLPRKVVLATRALTGARIPLPHPVTRAESVSLPGQGSARPRRNVTTALLVLLASATVASAQEAAPASDVEAVRPPAATVRQQARRATPAAHARDLEAAHAASPGDPEIALDLLRSLFFVAVDSSAALPRARAVLHTLHARSPAFAGEHEPLLLAYEGALRMLDAKHGAWPHARLQAVRDGLARLDRAVERAPDDAEVRYLRLVNTHYLPRFFGRREAARRDMNALAALLPLATLPPALHRVISDFVRTNAG